MKTQYIAPQAEVVDLHLELIMVTVSQGESKAETPDMPWGGAQYRNNLWNDLEK